MGREIIPLAPILERLGACEEAVIWARRRRVSRHAWHSCERGDWMLWLAVRAGVDHRLVVLAACDCARLAIVHVPAGDERPLHAIEAAEAWAAGYVTLQYVSYAAAAAYAAAADAFAAADAASSAADAAAADAADVASAAANAASAAPADKVARLVRERISFDLIAEVLL